MLSEWEGMYITCLDQCPHNLQNDYSLMAFSWQGILTCLLACLVRRCFFLYLTLWKLFLSVFYNSRPVFICHQWLLHQPVPVRPVSYEHPSFHPLCMNTASPSFGGKEPILADDGLKAGMHPGTIPNQLHSVYTIHTPFTHGLIPTGGLESPICLICIVQCESPSHPALFGI